MRPDYSSKLMMIAAAIFFATLPGCMAMNRRILELYDATMIRCDEKRDLSRIREETREELAIERDKERRLAAERDVELARAAAEKQRLEMELCRANRESEQLRIQSNLRDNMESKVAFNLRQGLEVGELEVDEEKLQQLLKERKDAPPPNQNLTNTPSCGCCEQQCGCAGGVIKRNCPRCCRKPCEKDCGGPQALRDIAQQPLREPLRPTEIPLKLPVKLTFGMQQPRIESTRVVTERLTDPDTQLLHGDSCTKCASGDMAAVNAVDPNAPMPPSPTKSFDDVLKGSSQVERIADRPKPLPQPEPINFEHSFNK